MAGMRTRILHLAIVAIIVVVESIANAGFFGLTGTPISDKDRNTFKLFGDPNDPGYVLNTYAMERSIADGASVPVHVETRLVTFHLDKSALDEAFDQMADEENLSDVEREILASKAAHVKTLLLNPERIQAEAADFIHLIRIEAHQSGFRVLAAFTLAFKQMGQGAAQNRRAAQGLVKLFKHRIDRKPILFSRRGLKIRG